MKSTFFGKPVQGRNEKLYIVLTKKNEIGSHPAQKEDEVVKSSKDYKIMLAFLGDIRFAKGVIFYT